MSEFDVNLIREFERRPGFYDRNSLHFKDKIYNAQEWQEISNNLGYDVALLKDRMLQLRNRYNLEKRRLENLAEEYPTKIIQSQWPLYEHLHFLSTHIRPRRSYKRMLTRPSTDFRPLSNPSSSSGTGNSQSNGMVTVKLENGIDGDSEGNSNPEEPDLEYEGGNSMFAVNGTHTDVATPPSKPISVRNIDCMRTIVPKNNIRPLSSESVVPEKRMKLDSMRIQKYDAFGKFLASSLIEMPPDRALVLVEKFTSDLVKALIKEHSQNDNPKDPVDVSDDEVH